MLVRSTRVPVLLHLGVFLITLSGLVFEIGLTRIYSATIWYHFTFVAVSVALLGWGLGGLARAPAEAPVGCAVAREGGGVRARSTPSRSRSCLLALVVKFPFTLERLPMYFIAPLVPFLLAGMALSMIFDLHRASASSSLYFADLVGASLGALGVTLLLQSVRRRGGGAGRRDRAVRRGGVPVAARLRAGAVVGWRSVVIACCASRTSARACFRVIPGHAQGDAPADGRAAAARGSRRPAGTPTRASTPSRDFAAPYLARLYIDSDAWTSILEWDGNLDSVRDMRDWYRALPFKFAPNAETLIIGPGGGADVLVALASGSRKVTAVELNPLMLQFVRHYGARAGNLYNRPDVEVIQSEGRNFISRTDRKFDVILLGFVDSWASVASGGLSLSENYLYTTEAFARYYDHLNDDGMLVILRWDVGHAAPRLELGRAPRRRRGVASAIVALVEKREGEPRRIRRR